MVFLPLLKTMRPYQWYKNLLLFAGLVFSNKLPETRYYFPVFLGFFFFCLLSGSVYILNDIVDRRKDRLHPIKKTRPIASGDLGVGLSLVVMALIVIGAPVASYFLITPIFSLILVLYFLLFLLYTFILKYIVIVDAFTIGTGFVLRAVAGVAIIEGAQLSWWLIICTLLLALFLAFGKRRAEIVKMGVKAENYRCVYQVYTEEMLSHLVSMLAGATIVVYCLYSSTAGPQGMALTIPFVIFAIIKYMQLMYTENMGAEPEKMFSNPYMLGCLLLWATVVLFVLYGKGDLVMELLKF